MNGNLLQIVHDRCRDPDRIAIATAAGARYRYRDLLERAARIARLLTDLGVTPGDRIAAQVDKSPEALMLYLGCLQAGAVYLPLNVGYTEAEIAYFLGDAEPRVAVCRPAAEAAFAALAARTGVAHVLTLDAAGGGSLAERAAATAEGAPGTAIVPRAADDLAAILYTSGTTGRSKGAMLTHGNLVSNALTLVEAWRFTEADVILHALPIFHTHGLFVATNIALMTGGGLRFLPAFDAAEVIRELRHATVMMGVPTFYTRLLAEPGFTAAACAPLRLFISGSAPLSPETFKAFEARTGHAILERYGMTETNMNTSNPYDGPRRPGTVGPPLPGVEIRIVDRESGALLPPGAVGSIEIRGPNVFKGYWRMPDKTAAELRPDGFFISGDLGLIDEQGYVQIVGRDKDLIISGGYNVYPAEVEVALDALPQIAESAVIGLPHPDFGEGVAAVVVLRPGVAASEAELRAALQGSLARYKLPKRVFFVEAMPRNAMGKVQKTLLRERYQASFAAAG